MGQVIGFVGKRLTAPRHTHGSRRTLYEERDINKAASNLGFPKLLTKLLRPPARIPSSFARAEVSIDFDLNLLPTYLRCILTSTYFQPT